MTSSVSGRSPQNGKKVPMGIRFWPSGARRLVLRCCRTLILGVKSGNDRMPTIHSALCFKSDSVLRDCPERMFCIHDRCSVKSKSLKCTNLGTCFDTSHMPDVVDDASMCIV